MCECVYGWVNGTVTVKSFGPYIVKRNISIRHLPSSHFPFSESALLVKYECTRKEFDKVNKTKEEIGEKKWEEKDKIQD